MRTFAAIFCGLLLLLSCSAPAWAQESPSPAAPYMISEAELTRLTEIFATLNEKLQKATAALETSKTGYADLLKDRDALQQEFDALTERFQVLQKEWGVLKKESAASTARLERLAQDYQALKTAWADLTDSYEKAKESWTQYAAEAAAKIDRLTAQRNALGMVAGIETVLLILALVL